MFKNLRKAEGFTLIELIVVIAVLLLLMAIALPSFLGVRDKAKVTGVKSNLNVSYHDAKSEWADNDNDPTYGTDSDAFASILRSDEPGIAYATGTTGAPTDDKVYVNVNDDVITLASKASDGKIYTIEADEDAGTLVRGKY